MNTVVLYTRTTSLLSALQNQLTNRNFTGKNEMGNGPVARENAARWLENAHKKTKKQNSNILDKFYGNL